MSTLRKLFSGYTGGGHAAKNGKFSTTKNNHNRDKYGRPTVIFAYSHKQLKRWLGVERYKTAVKEASESFNPDDYLYVVLRNENHNNLPSYLNPIYRGAYYEPKHRKQ